MGIDLLRQQPRWKDMLVEMRQIITNLNEQVFSFFCLLVVKINKFRLIIT